MQTRATTAQTVVVSEDAGQFTHSSANRRVTISAEEYQQYQRLLSLQANSSIATLSQTGSSVACIASSHSFNHWVIDSGASDHMTGTPSILSGRQSLGKPSRVTLADGSTTNVTGLGFVHVTSSLTLDSVLQVPRFPLNLMSVSKLTKSLNCLITFFPNGCVFQDLKTGRKIGGGVECGGLYYFFDDVHPSSVAPQSSVSPYQHHCRLGHPSLENLKRLEPSCSHVDALPCEICEFSKHLKVSFYPRVESRASRPFKLVHSDIWGPMHVPNIFGFQYYVIFVDDFSRVTYLYLMKMRSELSSIFKSFYMEIKTQFDTCICIFRSNNAREYFKNTLSQFFDDHGIIHQSSCARTPQQNGVAERKIRHLSEVMRAMLFQMQVPKSYWSDAVLTVCYLINRMPSSVLRGSGPSPRPLQVYVRRPKVSPVSSQPESPMPSQPEPPVPSQPAPSQPEPSEQTCPPSPTAPSSPPLRDPDDLDRPIAHRKGIRSCTIHPIAQRPYLCLSGGKQWRMRCLLFIIIHHNGTWELISLPAGKTTVGCRWVFTVKYHPDDTIEWYKARLVAKGYTQTYGVDYAETFSPVAKINSVLILISLAANFSWPLFQLDVKNAFLHGDLIEEVYMEQPPGFVAQGERSRVCRLRKALYGLKQSPPAWFGRFSDTMLQFGMRRSHSDHSVFSLQSERGKIILIVYVDDIIITGDH
ncbi:hypothetical protein Vadar_006185 [Vaccinium darrowii]|uniref:Uncharacterized protein n=1 Tax=Vaccinium darrowii TaxID=229202 RepID=A0ACB7XWX9_9ERIC|nr:hypothetical protein Vadar_006185 [Vaccinium darrowii]